jgi:hypothetical protein
MTEEEAGEVAQGIIQSYVGPDHRVSDLSSLYRVLVQALQGAHEQGWEDHAEADKMWPSTRDASPTSSGTWRDTSPPSDRRA